ncbi:uncharacterized protein RAG0_13750 [Rhynchosporium agropyri]|uniref:Uncharacterized protein n=1 Tax=Rhynchosporium agropyri TaxID=914238 RepID=A0A1E1LE07_9HELO|nr:uncharacterized protein RAG0_13750 [Rhynchosporium agropyri]
MKLKSISKLVKKLLYSKFFKSEDCKNKQVGSFAATRPLNIFKKLHPELIIYLADFLPLSSSAILALSCRTAYEILGTRFWARLRADDEQLQCFEFLSLLSRDMSRDDYVPCYHFHVLHFCEILPGVLQLPPLPYYQYHRTLCKRAEVLGKVAKYMHSGFQFRTVQMAMKMYRLHLDYQPWLEALCHNSKASMVQGEFPLKFKNSVRIINGFLLFCSQRIILLPPGLTAADLNRCGFDICPHIMLTAHRVAPNLPETSECAIDHDHAIERCIRSSAITSCTSCPTEYQLRMEDCENFGTAVVITKWMDLGKGETVADPKWWSHLSNEYMAPNSGVLLEGQVRSDLISIRDAFRQLDSSELDRILPLSVVKRLFHFSKRART